MAKIIPSRNEFLVDNNEKMSKSRGNVVNPDDIVASHGADSLRYMRCLWDHWKLLFLGQQMD